MIVGFCEVEFELSCMVASLAGLVSGGRADERLNII
jgi:hypothetical protein